MLAKLLIVLCCLLAFQAGSGETHNAIHVAIDGLNTDKGQVICSLYSSAAGFPKNEKKAIAHAESLITNRRADCKFAGIPPGRYAISDLPPNSHPFITGESRLRFGFEIISSPPRLCECGKRCLLSTFA